MLSPVDLRLVRIFFCLDTDIDLRLWQILGDKIKKVSFIDVSIVAEINVTFQDWHGFVAVMTFF